MSPSKLEKMKRALMRSNTRMLLWAVMLFQALAMLLIAFQKGTVNLQALALAVALPLATWLVTRLMGRVWPVDRAILILVMLLCSVGLITLSDIARADVTPRTQAYYALAGVAAMLVPVDGNTGENAYIDMQLMSLCAHRLIPRSSFSLAAGMFCCRKNRLDMIGWGQ